MKLNEHGRLIAIQVVSSLKVISGSGGLPYWQWVVSLSTWLDLEAYRRRRQQTAAVLGYRPSWRSISVYFTACSNGLWKLLLCDGGGVWEGASPLPSI